MVPRLVSQSQGQINRRWYLITPKYIKDMVAPENLKTFKVMDEIFVGVKDMHCKKRLVIFPSPAGMSLTKLSMVGKN